MKRGMLKQNFSKKKLICVFALIVCLLAAVFGLAACNDGGETEEKLESVTITNKTALTAEWTVGDADRTVEVAILPATYETSVTVASSNTSVVSVSGTTLTAVAEGTAIITASAEGLSDTVQITVKAAPITLESVTITNKAELTAEWVEEDADRTVEVALSPASYEAEITVASSDSSVISVSGTTITAVSAGTATITASAEGHSDSVEITVKSLIKYSVGGMVSTYAGASSSWAIPSETQLSFVETSNGKTYSAVTTDGGEYTAELPAGTYSVSANGYAAAELTVTEDSDEADLSLRYVLFGTSDYFTVSEDEKNITFAEGNWHGLELNATADNFVISFHAQGTSKRATDYYDSEHDSATGIGLKVWGADSSSFEFQLGYIDASWFGLRNTSTWAGQGIGWAGEAAWATNFMEIGLDVIIVKNGNVFSAYFFTNLTNQWKLASTLTFSAEISKYELYYWFGESFVLSNFSYTPDLSPLNIDVNIGATENGSVTVDGTYSLGQSVVLTVAPAEGYILSAITVNGVDYSSSVTAAGTLTLTSVMLLELNVEAAFDVAPEKTYVVSGSVSAVAGASSAWSVPAGTSLSFIGSDGEGTFIAEVANGAYSVELPAGTYSVSANGYATTEITVSEAATVNLTLRYVLFGTSQYFTVSDDEKTVTFSSEQYKGLAVNVNDGDFEFAFHLQGSSANATDYADGLGFKVIGASSDFAFQFGYIDGSWWALRNTSSWSGANVGDSTVTCLQSTGIDIKIVKSGNTYSAYYKTDASADWQLATSVTFEGATSYEFYYWNAQYFTASNISYTPVKDET